MFETLCCFDSVAMNFKFSSVFIKYIAIEISLSAISAVKRLIAINLIDLCIYKYTHMNEYI